jgi:MurNAc alpha-1-phosphate uridylyltransferase
LPLLGEQPFVVINADVLCNYPLQQLRHCALRSAHLVLIDNPPHHPQGDFHLGSDGVLSEHGQPALTFSGIGLYQPSLFHNLPAGPLKLRPVLTQAMQQHAVTAEHHTGLWLDIGTPERLQAINASGW